MAADDNVVREGKYGEKMIEVKVRFWTDSIAKEGHVIPKHAWTSGMVRIDTNKTHGITPKQPKPFNSLLEMNGAIERVLLEHGIMLHPSRKMQKYMVGD